jgi:hypothetical protein
MCKISFKVARHESLIYYSVAVIVQIELERNRLDLAKKAAGGARKWAQDSLLVNIAESWIGMREVYLTSTLETVHHSSFAGR